MRLAVTPNRQELDPRGSIRTLRGGPNVVQKFPESFFISSHPALFRRRLSLPDEPASPCSESEWGSIWTAVQHAGVQKDPSMRSQMVGVTQLICFLQLFYTTLAAQLH